MVVCGGAVVQWFTYFVVVNVVERMKAKKKKEKTTDRVKMDLMKLGEKKTGAGGGSGHCKV